MDIRKTTRFLYAYNKVIGLWELCGLGTTRRSGKGRTGLYFNQYMGYKPVATAVSLQSFAPGQGIALIYKVPVHPGFIVITPGVVYIEL